MFLWCFWAPHARETAKKRDKKIEGKRRQDFFSPPSLFRPKVFDMDFPQKVL
jgi:hypothetical protein